MLYLCARGGGRWRLCWRRAMNCANRDERCGRRVRSYESNRRLGGPGGRQSGATAKVFIRWCSDDLRARSKSALEKGTCRMRCGHQHGRRFGGRNGFGFKGGLRRHRRSIGFLDRCHAGRGNPSRSDAGREKLFFGLPGNPVSALVSFLLLARPALLRLQGARDVLPRSIPTTLSAALANEGVRRHFYARGLG